MLVVSHWQERRKIESSFFGGKICGVAATNALELGIDVGEIDATLHLGFPGNIARYFPSCFNIHGLLNVFNSFVSVELSNFLSTFF